MDSLSLVGEAVGGGVSAHGRDSNSVFKRHIANGEGFEQAQWIVPCVVGLSAG